MKNNRMQRGYSLVEMLVVVAIIGILMLVTIPNFIVMRKSSIVKGGMRQFTNDLRAARQHAVAKSVLVAVSIDPGKRIYYFRESTDEGANWDLLGSHNPKYLPEAVYLENGSGTAAFTDTVESDGLPDVVFERTGVARVPSSPSGLGQILLKTDYTDIPKPTYTISIRTTGMVSTE